MSVYSRLKYLHLAYFSKPSGQRCLHRAIRRNTVRRIVEIGVGDLRRALRMIDLAARCGGEVREIKYTGIDLFEARGDDRSPLMLKHAHKMLIATGAKIKLVPGNPFDGLSRTANTLMGTDLLLISADVDAAALEQAWFYVPRLLHERSVVFQATSDEGEGVSYHRVAADEIAQRARSNQRRRAA
jgi:hypothetical protein